MLDGRTAARVSTVHYLMPLLWSVSRECPTPTMFVSVGARDDAIEHCTACSGGRLIEGAAVQRRLRRLALVDPDRALCVAWLRIHNDGAEIAGAAGATSEGRARLSGPLSAPVGRRDDGRALVSVLPRRIGAHGTVVLAGGGSVPCCTGRRIVVPYATCLMLASTCRAECHRLVRHVPVNRTILSKLCTTHRAAVLEGTRCTTLSAATLGTVAAVARVPWTGGTGGNWGVSLQGAALI